jgi:uncharacterized membrane protein (DUF2068 family)
MERRRVDLVPAIGVFKLLKATLLVIVAVAMLLEMPQQFALEVEHTLHRLGIGAGRHAVQRLVERLWRLDVTDEKRLALFALGYASVFTTEGVGLLLRRRWAEWMTVFVTASFIPFEVYELVHRFGAVKLVLLALNVAIVVYLLQRRFEDRARFVERARLRPVTT